MRVEGGSRVTLLHTPDTNCQIREEETDGAMYVVEVVEFTGVELRRYSENSKCARECLGNASDGAKIH